MDKLEPDVILVSPLERTLETCSRVFKDRNIPVFAEPVLSQAFRTSCDIGGDLQGKKKRFPNYDFTSVEKGGDLWFIKNDCEENQKKYFSFLQ